MAAKARPATLACTISVLAAIALATLAGTTALAQDSRAAPEAATGWGSSALATAKSHMVADRQPDGDRGRPRDAARRRQRGRCSDRHPAGPQPGRAAVLRPRRRRLHPPLGCSRPAAQGLRRTGDGARCRHRRPVSASTAGRAVSTTRCCGGLSVGVPGTLRALEALHRRHGRLPWARLFAPAIRLAADGFRVPPRLHLLLRWYGAESFAPAARRYFFDHDRQRPPGGLPASQPRVRRTLRAIAERGAEAFYKGPIAEAIVKAVARSAPDHQGDMTVADLAGYAVKERDPVCIAYRGHRVCGMGPPSSGGLAVAQVLKLRRALRAGQEPGRGHERQGAAPHRRSREARLRRPRRLHRRSRFRADACRPAQCRLSRLAPRRSSIRQPPWPVRRPARRRRRRAGVYGDDATVEAAGTSHFSIVDGDGNVLAMTTTIEAAFGSRLWAAGFLLNNELTDFAFQPVDRGRPAARQRAWGPASARAARWRRPSCSTRTASRGPRSARPAAAASSSTW